MKLCIDVGNTQVKIGVFSMPQSEEVDSYGDLVAFERWDDLTRPLLVELLSKYKVQAAIISSTRGSHLEVRTFLEEQLDLVLKLSSETALPIRNNYESPKTLGNDRLAGAVAATTFYPKEHVLVVDAGTCITYDFVTKDRCYHGGSILPGITMRFNAMHHFTAKLPLLKAEDLSSFIGKTTKTSMQTGVLYGVLHELRGFKAQYEEEFGHIRVIVTGGDASYFESQLKNEIFAQPKLILYGLNRILEYNINRTETD